MSDIYIQAWKLGCKGITIYRDGCRDGVLVSTDDKKESKFHYHDAPKRPKDLPCEVFSVKAHGQQYVVAVGLMDNNPYEVFSFRYNDKITLTKGFIRKNSRGRYDILADDKSSYIEDITSEMSQVEESTTRLVSTSLRHGAAITFLVEQLLKARGNGFQDFSKVMARVLKKYIKDTTVVTGVTCENCGSTEIIYKDGCPQCNNCGNSKCG